MPTTPLGLSYPDNLGSTELWAHLSALANTANTAIQAVADEVGLPPVTAVDEAALASIPSPATGMHVWVTTEKLFYHYNGTAWFADRKVSHYGRNKPAAVSVASGGGFATVTFSGLGYDRGGAFEYGDPLTLGHFKYVRPVIALVSVDAQMQWQDNSSSTRELRLMRSIDNGVSWQQFDVVVNRGAISQILHSEVYMEPGHLLRLEAANNHTSALDLGGAVSANRIRFRTEKY